MNASKKVPEKVLVFLLCHVSESSVFFSSSTTWKSLLDNKSVCETELLNELLTETSGGKNGGLKIQINKKMKIKKLVKKVISMNISKQENTEP